MGKVTALVATVTFALALSAVAPSQAMAASPYDRPNAMHCVAHGVYINAPTNVPTSGDVMWQAEVQIYNTATGRWETNFTTAQFTNRADSVFVTAGPWSGGSGDEQYSTLVAITAGTGQVQIRIYNHFWRAEQGQWVYINNGWFSTIDGTATGAQTCILDNGPIVV